MNYLDLMFKLSRKKIHGKVRVHKSQDILYGTRTYHYEISRESCHKRFVPVLGGPDISIVAFPKGWVLERVWDGSRKRDKLAWTPQIAVATSESPIIVNRNGVNRKCFYCDKDEVMEGYRNICNVCFLERINRTTINTRIGGDSSDSPKSADFANPQDVNRNGVIRGEL